MENKEGFKILIIEDDQIHRTVLEDILSDEGYLITTAINGKDGMAKLEIDMPDLVITDIRMPIMDGYAVCRELRDNPKTKYIPVIVLTANTDMDDLILSFSHGAFDFIRKPFEEKELMARINSAVKFKSLRDEYIKEKQKTAMLELAGAASHELNQPLTILKTTEYLLRDKYKKNVLDKSDFEKYLSKIEDSVNRISAIITKINSIEEYKTKDYVMGKKIIDLNESIKKEIKEDVEK